MWVLNQRGLQQKVVWRRKGIKGIGFAYSYQSLNYLQLVGCKCINLVSFITKDLSRGKLYAIVTSSYKEDAKQLLY